MTEKPDNKNIQESSGSSDIVLQESGRMISLDDFKSLIYQFNAKPDTESRLLKDRKILNLADIRSINERVTSKLRNHNVITNTPSINFILSKRTIKDFSAWKEFERENWDTINEQIISISINWDIYIKLPQYEYPQRHSLKVRIGSAIPPKDMFQLFFTSDDALELLEAGATGICKVDFINNVLATELLNIISSWYEGLEDLPESERIQTFLKNQGKFSSKILRNLFPILCLIIAFQYSDYFFPFLGIKNEISINSLLTISIIFIAIFRFGEVTGRRIEKSIDRRIDEFEEYPRFSITRGDLRAIDKFKQKNQQLTNQIISRFFWNVFAFFVSYVLHLVIDVFT